MKKKVSRRRKKKFCFPIDEKRSRVGELSKRDEGSFMITENCFTGEIMNEKCREGWI